MQSSGPRVTFVYILSYTRVRLSGGHYFVGSKKKIRERMILDYTHAHPFVGV